MKNKISLFILILLPSLLNAASKGGLSKVNNLFETVLGWILAAAVIISTIALVWAGIKVMFGGRAFHEYAVVITSAIVIASASAIIGLIFI